MKIFLDANIFLDIFDNTRAFHKYSVDFYTYALKQKYKLFTSCDIITTLYYVNSKKNKTEALLNIRGINQLLKIIEFSNKEVEQTCKLMIDDTDFADLEDTIQYVLAKKLECDCIISNDKHFVSKELTLLTSKDFLSRIK